MRAVDGVRFAAAALEGARVRTGLMLLAMAIGVAAVVLLTALGEGARRYIAGEFSALGTNLLVVLPGRSETTGGMPPITGETPRDLTIEDARALYRSPTVTHVAPVNVGEAVISYGGRERDVIVLGSTAELREARELVIDRGKFLPHENPHQARPICVIGTTIEEELFGAGRGLGRWLRLGDRRFRVIGILGSRGESIGVDLDDVCIIPVASAQQLFDTQSLFRILIKARSRDDVKSCQEEIREIIAERHQGEEDVTVITQDAIMSAFDRIFRALTVTLAGIAGISLFVAGILIMNVMLVAVSQRTAEIGLLKALGTTTRSIRALFLTEAALLSFLGAVVGLGLGWLASLLLGGLIPALPITPPAWAMGSAVGVAVASGVLFSWLPAARAARLDPVLALSRR